MTQMLSFGAALEAAGVNVRYLPDWDKPAEPGYLWRELDGEPAGFMNHHTATSVYTPNRTKANGWAGLSLAGSERLYQEDYGDGLYEPVFVIANAYPAPISAGGGDYKVLTKVRHGLPVNGRPDTDTDNWYGNTHYYSVEWVLNGRGAPIDQRVFDMMVVVQGVWLDMYGRSPEALICHGHHTNRKVDLWGGQFSDSNRDGYQKTIEAIRKAVEEAYNMIMWVNDWTDKSWMTWFNDTDIPGVNGDGRYYCKNDGTYDFAAQTGVAWGDGPIDGGATYAEKINAINHVFQGFALVLDQSGA
jgi:hypothetical protein